MILASQIVVVLASIGVMLVILRVVLTMRHVPTYADIAKYGSIDITHSLNMRQEEEYTVRTPSWLKNSDTPQENL